MAVFFIALPGEEDRYMDAARYAIEEHDLLFYDEGGEEVGRVVDFQDMAGASVLRAVEGEGDEEVDQDDD